jgi:hypothetical protein
MLLNKSHLHKLKRINSRLLCLTSLLQVQLEIIQMLGLGLLHYVLFNQGFPSPGVEAVVAVVVNSTIRRGLSHMISNNNNTARTSEEPIFPAVEAVEDEVASSIFKLEQPRVKAQVQPVQAVEGVA